MLPALWVENPFLHQNVKQRIVDGRIINQKKKRKLSKQQEQQEHKKDGNHPPQSGKPRQKFDAYLKYSGMAFQMGIIILIGAYAGKMLDGRFQTEKPYFTVLLALLAIFAALYISLKDLFVKPKDKP